MKTGEFAGKYWRVYDDTDVEIVDIEQEATDKDSCYINNYAERAIVWEDGEEPRYDDGTPVDWGEEV